MLHFLAIALFLGSPESSQAAPFFSTPEASCSSVDFRNEFPLQMRNQNNISWCFAHDAADYLQYTYRLPEQISAADIAIAYSETNVSRLITFFKRVFSQQARRTPPQTGFIAKAVKKIQKEGYCPESVFPSEFWTRSNSARGTEEKVGILDAILDLYSLHDQVKRSQIKSAQELPHSYHLKNMNQDLLFDFLKNYKKSHLLSKIRSQVCQNDRKVFPTNPISTHFNLRNKKIFQKINEQFDNKMPTSIDFYSGIFENYDQYQRKVDDLHTVLLYGRRFDPITQECEYLMKNSYGKDCSIYDPKIKCEAGYLWFPESKIFRTITTFYRINRL